MDIEISEPQSAPPPGLMQFSAFPSPPRSPCRPTSVSCSFGDFQKSFYKYVLTTALFSLRNGRIDTGTCQLSPIRPGSSPCGMTLSSMPSSLTAK
jgi:hypothetical protein